MLLVFVYFAMNPFITVIELSKGVQEKDSERLSELIDYPILRQNIKEQLYVKIINLVSAKIQKDQSIEAAIATSLANQISDGLTDVFITPSGLAAVLEGKSPSNLLTENLSVFQRNNLFTKAKFKYESLNQFSIQAPSANGQIFKITLERNGLFWKIVNITILLDERFLYK